MCEPSSSQAAEDDGINSCLVAARNGSADALGQLLQLAEEYLLRVANKELGGRLRAKSGASDIVQETFLEAQRIFGRFEGSTSAEFQAWLRGILRNKLSELRRRYRTTAKRQLNREVALGGSQSSLGAVDDVTPGGSRTPSSVVSGNEESIRVHQAMSRLPEHYRQVIVWHEWEHLPFDEIAGRLDRSVDAARMLWWRAVDRLGNELDSQ